MFDNSIRISGTIVISFRTLRYCLSVPISRLVNARLILSGYRVKISLQIYHQLIFRKEKKKTLILHTLKMIIIVRRILKIRKIGILGRNRDNGSENKKSKKKKKSILDFSEFRVSNFSQSFGLVRVSTLIQKSSFISNFCTKIFFFFFFRKKKESSNERDKDGKIF